MSELSSEQLQVLSVLVPDHLCTAADLTARIADTGERYLEPAEVAAAARSLTRRGLAARRTLSGTPRWVITSAGQGIARRAARTETKGR